MRWIVLILVAAIAGGIGAAAGYSLGTHSRGTDGDRPRATAFAQELSSVWCSSCRPTTVEQVAPRLWRVDYGRICFDLDLDRFQMEMDSTATLPFKGVSVAPCS